MHKTNDSSEVLTLNVKISPSGQRKIVPGGDIHLCKITNSAIDPGTNTYDFLLFRSLQEIIDCLNKSRNVLGFISYTEGKLTTVIVAKAGKRVF
jgi:hypothetical protein